MTPAELRAEGVLEIGFAYAFPFVRTTKRLVLITGMHCLNRVREYSYMIPRWRELLAIGWTSYEVAAMWGVSQSDVWEMTLHGKRLPRANKHRDRRAELQRRRSRLGLSA